MSACPACRQGACEDCSTLGLYCSCCGARVHRDEDDDDSEDE
jgi:hypothetical protein